MTSIPKDEHGRLHFFSPSYDYLAGIKEKEPEMKYELAVMSRKYELAVMSREELTEELSNLQLDYQDRIDDIEGLEDRLEELRLDNLELKSTVAWFEYETALRDSVTAL